MVGLILVVFVTLVFLICREIVMWYWKINKVVELLTTIAENTKKPTS